MSSKGKRIFASSMQKRSPQQCILEVTRTDPADPRSAILVVKSTSSTHLGIHSSRVLSRTKLVHLANQRDPLQCRSVNDKTVLIQRLSDVDHDGLFLAFDDKEEHKQFLQLMESIRMQLMVPAERTAFHIARREDDVSKQDHEHDKNSDLYHPRNVSDALQSNFVPESDTAPRWTTSSYSQSTPAAKHWDTHESRSPAAIGQSSLFYHSSSRDASSRSATSQMWDRRERLQQQLEAIERAAAQRRQLLVDLIDTHDRKHDAAVRRHCYAQQEQALRGGSHNQAPPAQQSTASSTAAVVAATPIAAPHDVFDPTAVDNVDSRSLLQSIRSLIATSSSAHPPLRSAVGAGVSYSNSPFAVSVSQPAVSERAPSVARRLVEDEPPLPSVVVERYPSRSPLPATPYSGGGGGGAQQPLTAFLSNEEKGVLQQIQDLLRFNASSLPGSESASMQQASSRASPAPPPHASAITPASHHIDPAAAPPQQQLLIDDDFHLSNDEADALAKALQMEAAIIQRANQHTAWMALEGTQPTLQPVEQQLNAWSVAEGLSMPKPAMIIAAAASEQSMVAAPPSSSAPQASSPVSVSAPPPPPNPPRPNNNNSVNPPQPLVAGLLDSKPPVTAAAATANTTAAVVSKKLELAVSPTAPSSTTAAPPPQQPAASSETTSSTTARGKSDSVWREVRDRATGKSYYVNRVTNKTTWNVNDTDLGQPTSGAEEGAAPAAGGPKEPSSPALPKKASSSTIAATTEGKEEPGKDWKAMTHPATGKTYYVHKVTKKTTWKLEETLDGGGIDEGSPSPTPPTPSAVAAAVPPSKLPQQPKPTSSDWIAKLHPETGKTYYVNQVTKARTWNIKDTDLENNSSSAALSTPPTTAAAEKGPAAAAPPSRAAELPPGWRAVKDPNTGKTYYAQKATGKVSWTLPKE